MSSESEIRIRNRGERKGRRDGRRVPLTPALAIEIVEEWGKPTFHKLDAYYDPRIEWYSSREASIYTEHYSDGFWEVVVQRSRVLRTITVWAEWKTLPDDSPAPVKEIARRLAMTPADVAAIVYPPDKFGAWDDSQEPEREEARE